MPLSSRIGIPRIIHQTWKSRQIPEGLGFPETWIEKNPGWKYCFWTDEDLLAFMREERPDLLPLYLSYPLPVQRADLARYAILEKFGGIYADIDTRCLASIEPIAGDHRVILCEEPERHHEPALTRGMARLWFNGTMASPPGHPFWKKVIDLCKLMGDLRDRDVLETTGPLLLTAAVEGWDEKDTLSLNSCGLFADIDVHGRNSGAQSYGSFGHLTLSTHLWKGSWYASKSPNWWRRKVARLRQVRDRLSSGPRLDPARALARIDQNLLSRSKAKAADASVLVLIPVRDAAEDLPRCFELLRSLDHPRDRLHVWFGHGDSRDSSGTLISDFIDAHGHEFASAGLVDTDRNAPALDRRRRWKPKLQRKRRAGIAKARNDLLRQALKPHHDWVLWIDADVVDYPPDIVTQLMAAGERIVVPNCVLEPGGTSFDLNSFLSTAAPSRVELYRHVSDGLLQPPTYWPYRRHLDDLRYLDRVPLNGVGGTMLLVDADCHRAGLEFPELPYRHLIETEAFGQMARDAGVIPVGLPKLEVRHARK